MSWAYTLFGIFIITSIVIIANILIYICCQIGSKVQQTMSDTLVNYYGVNYQNERNRAVTDAWDKAQERVR